MFVTRTSTIRSNFFHGILLFYVLLNEVWNNRKRPPSDIAYLGWFIKQNKAGSLLYAQLAQWLERVIAVLSDITRSLVRVRHWASQFFLFLCSLPALANQSAVIASQSLTFYFFLLLFFRSSFIGGKRAKKKKITSVDAYLRTLYESKKVVRKKEMDWERDTRRGSD